MKVFKDFPTERPKNHFLDKIESPEDLKKLTIEELKVLADELREFLLFSVRQTGGHFGAGLGAIEITIALHYLLNMPSDKIVWDTGHQAYPHKILTGRRDRMHLIRKIDGLAAFPSIKESKFDAMSVGHSSTSISAALGMDEAVKHQKNNKNIFSVIGDGAMTAGIAFEAMMHAGHLNNNLKIILNDNDMSISKNKGGLSDYLTKIWASKSYKKLKSSGKKVLKNLPYGLHLTRNIKDGLKSAVMPGNLFEDLGLHYIGPIDGHDIPLLIKTITRMMELGILPPQEGIKVIETGVFPNAKELESSQSKFVEDRKKGYYNPIVGGAPMPMDFGEEVELEEIKHPQGLKIAEKAKNSRPSAGNPGRPLGSRTLAKETYSVSAIKDIAEKTNNLYNTLTAEARKVFKKKRLSKVQKEMLERVCESVVVAKEEKEWLSAAKKCVSNPDAILKLQPLQSVLDISAEHELDDYASAILYHSRKNSLQK